jgi:hypothetical protein
LADLRLVMTWEEATQRMASKVRGKLVNYSECIIMIRPFAVPFNVFIDGARTVGEWDTGLATRRPLGFRTCSKQAFELLLAAESEVQDCSFIIRNDCAPALSCLVRGSSRSPKLQGIAEQTHKPALHRQVQLSFLHASGEQLIRDGVDDGS